VRGLISFAVVAVAVVVQLTVVDRIAFPGGAGPDLVLLVVAALALARGPLAGVLTGFWAGLALDVAPPGSHFVGQDALVFCLIGYACGLLADDASGDGEPAHTALFEIVVTAAGAVCGEALVALLGVMLSDPRVTWPAITSVLPAAVAYDVLLCPFVLYAAAAALRLAGARDQGYRAGWSASQARTPVPGASQGAIRQLAGGNGPRLRLSDRSKGPGSIGGLRGPGDGGMPVTRREPQLKLGRPPKTSQKGAPGGAGRRTSMTGGLGAAFAASGLGAGPAKIRFGSSNLGRSLLGGSVFSRSSSPRGSSSPLGRSSRFGRAAFGRPAPLGRSSSLRHRGNLMGSPGGLAGHAPRFSRGSSLARLTGFLRRPAGPKSPGRGWLRGASSRGASSRGASSRGSSLGGSSLGGSSLGANSLGRRSLGLGRGTIGRGAFGRRGTGWAGARTPRLKARRTGRARLRIPRPKNPGAKRRWRAGGYR
jgi:rod shape-determining protein MreD